MNLLLHVLVTAQVIQLLLVPITLVIVSRNGATTSTTPSNRKK